MNKWITRSFFFFFEFDFLLNCEKNEIKFSIDNLYDVHILLAHFIIDQHREKIHFDTNNQMFFKPKWINQSIEYDHFTVVVIVVVVVDI